MTIHLVVGYNIKTTDVDLFFFTDKDKADAKVSLMEDDDIHSFVHQREGEVNDER